MQKDGGELMIANRSAPGAMIVNLCYADLETAIAWLCNAFGFVERYRYGPPEETIGAQLQLGGALVMLFGPRIGHGVAEDFTFRPPGPDEGSHAVTVRVASVDAHHDRARRAGARILLPPQTYEFGERQYSTQDLEGRLWTFTQSVTDVAPETWGARVP
jgi:uncharacterized glyoxalase superfamily protein PhnB